MARSISECTAKINFNIKLRNTLTDGTIASIAGGGALLNATLADGNGEDMVNRMWQRVGASILTGATEDIDLYDFAGIDIGGGSGKDGLGQAMDLEEIVALILIKASGAGSLEVMPANPSNYWTCMPQHTVARGNALKTNGLIVMYQPNHQAFDVFDGSSHVIRLGANGGDLTYSLYIWGRSADSYT